MLEIVVSLALLVGVFFTLVGSLGLLRLPDFYARLHAPTKATTLGVGSILLAAMLALAAEWQASLRELLVLGLLFFSAPVSAYLLARAALHLRVRSVARGDVPDVDR